MGEIPRLKRTGSLPDRGTGVPVDPRMAGSTYGALSEAGESMYRTGKTLLAEDKEIREREDSAARNVRLSEAERDVKIKLDEYAERFRGREDFENFEKDADTWMGELRNTVEPRFQGDRLSSAAFSVYFNRQMQEFSHLARTKKIDVIVKKGLGEFDRHYDEAMDDYANETDPNKKLVIRNNLEIDGQLRVKDGLFFRRDLDKRMKQFDKDVQEATITTGLGTEDTTKIQSIIDGIDKGEYPDLKAKEREVYKNTLRSHLEKVKNKQEVEADKAAIDTAYGTLKRVFGTGTTSVKPSVMNQSYQMMYDKLADPEFLKDWNLNPQRKHQLEMILKQEQLLSTQKIQETRNKREMQAMDGWVKGTITPTTINSWVQNEEMDVDKGKVWIGALEARTKAGANIATNDAVYLKLMMAATDATTDQERQAVRAAVTQAGNAYLLDAKAFEHMMSLTSPDNHPVFNNDYFKMAKESMKTRLGWQGTVGAFLKPEAGSIYTRAVTELVESVKKDKLQGAQIIQRSEQITLPYVQQFWKLLGMEPPKEKGAKESSMGPMGLTGKKAPSGVSSLMPPAASNKEKTIQDTMTGIWYFSNGTDWMEMK